MSIQDKKFSVAYLMVTITHYLMQRWGVDKDKFIEIDNKFGILAFIELAYEPLHLTGDEGIAIEIEEHIKMQGGDINEYTKK